MGGLQYEGQADLLPPESMQYLQQILQPQIAQQAGQAYSQYLQPYSPEQYQDVFQKSIVDPTMKTYEQKVLPSIQQRFVDAGAGSSSALNQALAQSAQNLSTGLGAQYMNFFNQQEANKLAALGQLGGLTGQKTFQPMYSQSQGILGPLIGASASLGAGAMPYMLSSKEVKENINNFDELGLSDLEKMKVKKYDYKEIAGGQKNRIGLIAEELPEQLIEKIDDILHVDLYALIGVMINSIKELSQKVKDLEAS